MTRRELLRFAGLAILTSPALPLEGFVVPPATPPAFVPIIIDEWQARILAQRLAAWEEIRRTLGIEARLLAECVRLETSRSNVVASASGEGSQDDPQETR